MSDRKKTPSLLKRDEQNRVIDPGEAARINEDLMKKLLTEKRAHEKDESMHVARTGKRDVVVHLAVTVLPSVDGHNIIGQREQEYGQWCFRLNARQLPASRATLIKAFAELAHIGKQAFVKLGMMRG